MDARLPKRTHDEAHAIAGPCWVPTTRYGTGETLKPVIKCNCNALIGLGNHSVHKDGSVTASFHHDSGACGWHVYIVLEDWSGEEFPVG